MSEPVIVRVTRRLFPKTDCGLVETRYGGTKKTMWLPDAVRHQMAGERVAYFNSEMIADGVSIRTRVADPGWS